MQTSPADSNQQAEAIDLRKLLFTILKKWQWILLGTLLGVTAAFLFLRYTPALFQATATVRVEDDNLGLYGDFADLTGTTLKDKLLTEVEILKSRSLIEASIEKLPLRVSYFSAGRFVDREMYNKAPFRVEYTRRDSLPFEGYFSVKIDPNQSNKFLLAAKGTDLEAVFKPQTVQFGEWVSFPPIKFRLVRIDSIPLEFEKYHFNFNKTVDIIERIRENLSIKQPVKEVSLVEISIKDVVPELTADFVNTLSQVYIDQDILIKAQVASQTLAFIDNLLSELSLKVQESGLQLEKFKRDNHIVDVELNTKLGLERVSNQEVQQNMLEIQKIAILNLEKQIADNQEVSNLSFNLEGNIDPVLIELIGILNQLNAERKSRLQVYTPESPYVLEIDQKIAETKRAIQQNIKVAKKRIEEQIQLLSRFIRDSKGSLTTIPETERVFINLLRSYEINQKVYDLLMEKRLEQSIARASVVSSARVVDKGIVPEAPVSPSKKLVYLLGFIMGGGGAIFVILLIDFFNNRIYLPTEVEHLTGIPVVGVIRNVENKGAPQSPIQVIANQRSAITESLRALRTNVQFIRNNSKKTPIISVTSSVSGEGKSFIISNLAAMFSLLDKKIIILELDLRKPKLHQRLSIPNDVGISSCLAGLADIQSVIKNTGLQNLDIVLAGPIPPNPAELIMGEQFGKIIEELSQSYDFIFIDTPPVGLVSDAIPITKLSDVCLYVFRYNYSLKQFAQIPKRIKEEHKLQNLYCVLNGFSEQSGSYGYYDGGGYYGGYYGQYNDGYFEDENPKTLWQKIKKQLRPARQKSKK